jgi:hypothetical protein
MSDLLANQQLRARLKLRHRGSAIGMQFLVSLGDALAVIAKIKKYVSIGTSQLLA